MIRFSAYYPRTEGGFFDLDYYVNKHMKMLKENLGEACVRTCVDDCLGTLTPGDPGPYIAIGHLEINVDTVQELLGLLAPLGAMIRADVPNYTDIAAFNIVSKIKE